MLKKLVKKSLKQLAGLLPALALLLAVSSVEAACFFWLHQPDVPEDLLNK